MKEIINLIMFIYYGFNIAIGFIIYGFWKGVLFLIIPISPFIYIVEKFLK